MADLSDKVIAAAARLWGKKPGAIRLVLRADSWEAEVWTWTNEEDPDDGMLSYRVLVRPNELVAYADEKAREAAYRAEKLYALLDILEGSLRRRTTEKSMRAQLGN